MPPLWRRRSKDVQIMQTSRRLVFLDNLRVVLIAMVIVHHVGQAYGPVGAWWPVQEPVRADILGPFFMVNRTFGMSLFFMIAGYFAALSCEKGGPKGLAKSRLQRLGIPLLIFTLLMVILQVFVLGPIEHGELGPVWPVDVIHFWFVQHLLLYSLGYALWRSLRRKDTEVRFSPADPPGFWSILAFSIGLALVIAIVRTWYDTDEWVYLFGYLRIAPVDLPRDLGMFIIGTLAYRNNWVMRFPSRAGYAWLLTGTLLASMWYMYDLWLVDVLAINDVVWGLIHPLWESLLCVSMCIGITVLFRDYVNLSGSLAREMALSTYAAYMLHVFVAVFFQSLARGFEVGPLSKFILVSLVTVPVSFLLGSLIRRPLRL